MKKVTMKSSTYPEVLLRYSQCVKDLSIDGLVLEVNQIHLLPDLLQGSLGAQGSKIRPDVAVGFGSNLGIQNNNN